MRGQRVDVIGVPMDLGQTLRGTDVGPTALRYAGLVERIGQMGFPCTDHGNIGVANLGGQPQHDELLSTIAHACAQLKEKVASSLSTGGIPVTLGGDHSIAIGSVAASMASAPRGLLWVDAHGDINTPDSSPSGNVHGMPLAVLLGQGHAQLLKVCQECQLAAEHVVLVGIRQLDSRERQFLKETGITVFTMRDIDEQGMGQIARRAVEQVSRSGSFHLSLDVDSLDPVDAPGVGTPVRGGLSFREAHLLMEVVADSGGLTAMDIVEINPMLDHGNRTAETAVDLVASALGASIF